MGNEPLVSVIIVNFNGQKYLKACLDSLYQGRYKNIETILVDNGSSDGSLALVGSIYKDIRIVDNKENLGLSIASNRGADLASGKYLFFFNNDTIADKNLIASLVKAMEVDERLGIAGCLTYTYDGRHLINAGVPCDIFGYPYAKGRPFYVDAGIFIRKELFYKIGRFDEKMFLYGEDRDICWRCWLYGYKVEVVEGAVFYHDSDCIRQDLSRYSTNINKRFIGEFNALRSLLKNYSAVSLLFILPLYGLISLAEALALLFSAKFAVVKRAYLRSYLENLRLLPNTLAMRERIQRERAISDWQIFSLLDKISGKVRLFFAMGLPRFSGQNKYEGSSYFST